MFKQKNITDKSLANTGERLIPAYSQGELVYGEHIVRYQAISELVRDKVVLDIASGSGYGSAIIGETAKQVFGVDNDRKSIRYAEKNYGSNSVIFRYGDGTKIPLKDNSVDVAISFETIEHIEEYKNFMQEIKRVLRPEGTFVLSTPNDLEYPEGNHFHIHEFTPAELQLLVSKYFAHNKSYYQGDWLYNALVEESFLSKTGTQLINTLQLAPVSINKCVYLFLLCSDQPITTSLKPLAAMSEHWSERNKLETELVIEGERIKYIATIRRLEKTIDQKHEELLKNLQKIDQLQQELSRIYKSRTWRFLRKTAGLRVKLSRSRK